MAELFWGKGSFNEDISGWVTSKVTTMKYMFRRATAFNQDISGWDTSKCTDMDLMFYGAANAFSQDISPWCVALISSEPSNFGNAGTDPIWGTCNCVLGMGRRESEVGCDECTAGKYSNSVGVEACASCEAGTYSDVRASYCSPCPPGSHRPSSESAECTPCTGST
jgi:surface protein